MTLLLSYAQEVPNMMASEHEAAGPKQKQITKDTKHGRDRSFSEEGAREICAMFVTKK